MKSIILAAGKGSRLKDLTKDRPKCLIIFAGKTLLEWQLEALRNAGITEIGVVKGYLEQTIVYPGLRYFLNREWEKTNMLRSLLCAEKWLREDTCVISYADILYPQETIHTLTKAEGDIVISYNTEWKQLWRKRFTDPLSDAETFKTDASGRLTEIGARATSLDDIKGQYMGLLKMTPFGFGRIADYLKDLPHETIDKMDMTSLLNRLLLAQVEIRTVPIDGRWLEIDNEGDLTLYNEMLKREELRLW